MSEHIEFVIDGQNVKIEAIGFKGSACEAATQEIEAKLGGMVTRSRKPEFYSKAETRATATRSH